jgi:hypothetical protein
VALAVNYTQVRPDLNPDLILTATLVSILLFEIVASREAGEMFASPVEVGAESDQPRVEPLAR